MSALLGFVALQAARAVPVAVNDSYTTQEDTPLTISGLQLTGSSFEPESVPFAAQWDYLNNLPNTAGAGYPVDGTNQDWKLGSFDVTTSTVGPWRKSPLPMAGPTIDYFVNNPAAPVYNVLTGGTAVTTYLFRNQWTLTDEQAATGQWSLRYLIDDGAIIYVNGTEAARVNMDAGQYTPSGTVTPATATVAAGNETTYSTANINLAGKLQPGVNMVSAELHQVTGNTNGDAVFDIGLTPLEPAGFTYVANVLGTAAPGNNSGSFDTNTGFNSTGALHVRVGNRTPTTATVLPISGGWVKQLPVPSAGTYTITFKYRLVVSPHYDTGEFIESVFKVDDTRLGGVQASGSLSGSGVSLYRFTGNGNNQAAGEVVDTEWQTYTQNVPLTAGQHQLTFALYNSTSSGSAAAPEVSDFYIDDFAVTLQGGAGVAGVLLNDTGGANRMAVKDTNPAHGTVVLNSNGSFTYTPARDYFGTDSFTYHVVDETGSSAPATVTLTVTPVQDPPVAVDDSYTTAEDTPLVVSAANGLLANDSDPDGDTLTATRRTNPLHGTVTVSANGAFTYTPEANYNGMDSFTYRVSDGIANSADRTVTITVTPVNDAPAGVADSYATLVNTPLNVTLKTSAGAPTTTQILVRPGSEIPLGDPTETDLPLWRYLDNGSNQGTAWRAPAFDDSTWATGRAELGYGDAVDGRPERTVVGYGPDANAKYATTYFRLGFSLAGKGALTSVGIRLMRDDAAAVYLNGTEIYRDRSANGFPNLAANPAYDAYASASLSSADEATLVDLSSYVDSAAALGALVDGNNLLAVEVHQAAGNSTDMSMDIELRAQRAPYGGVLANDTDADGDVLTAQLVSTTTRGTLVFNPDGTFTYTPPSNYTGTDSFVYRVTDGTLTSANTTVTITVASAGNLPPVAGNDSYTVAEDTVLTVNAPGVLANDTDPENAALTAQRLTNPEHGTLVFNTNGSFTYTPFANYNGPDSFTYRARDPGGASSAAATVSLTVTPVNDPPVAVAETYGTDPGQKLVVAAAQGLLANDTDVDGQVLTAQLVTSPASGTLNLYANGSFDYTPATGFTGTVTFTYRASDGTATSNTVTTTIHVNRAPVVAADAFTTAEDTVLTVNAANGVLKNDSDPEGSPLTARLVAAPLHGALVLNPDGSFSYSPANDYAGTDSFTYTAFDGTRSSAVATVSLTITPVNDAPVAGNDTYRSPPDEPLVVDAAAGLLKNDRDAEGSALTISLISNPTHGTLTLAPDGSFVYVPATGFTGTDSFTYRVSDGALFSAPATVEITVAQTSRDIVINEIMFRSGGGYPEVTNREFIELYNRGNNVIDLTGWRIDSGVSFAFPAGRTMAPGTYLVVAANTAAFQAAYPGVTNVIGGWTGTLSNSGENITIVDAFSDEVDKVHYATEGDWGQRVREATYNGWAWASLADGGGRSLELRNPLLTNDNGQNWSVSNAIGGTPGAVNGTHSTNIPPVISGVKHSPAVPKATDRVVISCVLEDETPVAGLSATLYWRDATATTPGAFQTVAMSSDGKGTWFAPLNPMQDLTIVEFYISATDGTNTRTWPAPTAEGQNANCQYQVDNAPVSSVAEMYRLVLTGAENQAYASVSSTSDRQFNTTLVVTRGQETSIRYLTSMRIRGASSRSYQFRPMRISIPADNDLDGGSRFNLNPRSPFLQHLGMKLFQAAGIRAPDSMQVELRRNGVKYTTTSGSTPDFGYWVRMEDIGGDFVNNHWPLTGTGNVYKKVRDEFFWRLITPPSDPNTLVDGWSKQNNSAANDWTDLTAFMTTWQTACFPHFPGTSPTNVANGDGSSKASVGSWNGTPFTPDEMDTLGTVADLDQWARWFAVMTILQDYETNISNGADDDYAVYLEPKVIGGVLRRRLQLVPHDLDTIFGLGDAPASFNSRGLYDATDESAVFRTLLPLLGNGTVPGNSAFRAKYFDAIKELLGTLFDADNTSNPTPPFYAFVDQHIGNWAPASTRTAIKDFMRQRRTYLLGLLGSAATTPPAGTANATVTASHGFLFISEVLANNVSAHANGTARPDVVELRNSGPSAINLSGMSLTDDPLNKTKFVFPSGTTLASGAYLVLYADSETGTPGTHLGFGLNAGGDRVLLYDSVANGQNVIDSIVFGLQAPDLSIGRTGAADTFWALCTPTIGAANTAVPTLAAPSGVKINEWLGNADYRAPDDFVELYNPATSPVALGGMSLTDDFINRPTRGMLPQLSFMGPGAFVVFEAKGSSAEPGNARELPFGIDATFGSIALIGANGAMVDRADVVAQFRDVSTGHSPDGTGGITQLNPPTPGFSNTALPDAAADVLNYLRITEMMYNPRTSSQSEYIEFRNISDTSATPVTLDLGGVTFTNGINYTFPAGTSLAPGAYYVIAGELAKFQAQFPGVTVGGVFSGKLDNAGEGVRFDLPGFNLPILDFKYSDDWYPSTDGGGDALHIVDATAQPVQWDKKAGWQAAPPSPGSSPAFSVYAGPDLAAVTGRPVYLDGSFFPGSFAFSDIALVWTTESGPAPVTFTTPNYQDANAIFTTPGVYVLRLTGTGPGGVTTTDSVSVTVNESYAEWAARVMAGQPAASRLPGADPDGDGVPNLVEYALNGNPLNASITGMPQVSSVGGRLSVTWQRGKAVDPSARVIAQVSDDLKNWEEGEGVIETVQTGSTSTTEIWTATSLSPFTSRPRAAMRLKVVLP